MKIYVAGGFAEKATVSGYMRRLEGVGYQISCDWTALESTDPSKTSDDQLTHEQQLEFAAADIKGVEDADVFWHIVASYTGSRGAFVELGYALARKKLIVVSGPHWRKTIFHSHAAQRFEEHEEAFAFLSNHWTVGPIPVPEALPAPTEADGLRAELETERFRSQRMREALLPLTKFVVHKDAKPTATRTITIAYKALIAAREAVGMSKDGTEG